VLNNGGGIEETGKHEELIKAGGMYTRFWEARQRARSWKISRN
jgi:ATP-binding cassette subfamily B protein